MKALRALLIYAGAVFVVGGLVAPWLYWLAQGVSDWPWLEGLGQQPFHRFVHRALLGAAILGLWPLLKVLGIASWKDLGVRFEAGWWRFFGAGFITGLGSLALIAVLALIAEARVPNEKATLVLVLKRIGSAGRTALVVACLEEILFRGAIFGGLARAHGWRIGLLVSSALYALFHFFAKPPPLADVSWTSGFAVLGEMAAGFARVQTPAFLSLLLAGFALALVYHRTGNLFGAIGLHAGWIFWMRCYGFLLRRNPAANETFWGSGKLIDGWLAVVILAGVSVTAMLVLPRRRGGTDVERAYSEGKMVA